MAIISSAALLIISVIISFEVASRYLFNSPTIWVWDVATQLMLVLVMLGLAEVYRRDLNVRVDIGLEGRSPRFRAVLDLLSTLLIIFVAVIITWTSWDYFHSSWSRGQRASSLFAPPLWPAKFLLPFGTAVLVLQIFAKLIRDIATLAYPEAASPKASIEEE